MPIGVETIYSPFSKLLILIILIFILSCAPANNYINNVIAKGSIEVDVKKTEDIEKTPKLKNEIIIKKFVNKKILNDIEIILPNYSNSNTTQNLINSFELAIYKKEIQNIRLNINEYFDLKDLNKIMLKKSKPGKIFIGTFGNEETEIVKNYCKDGILFFSFSSDIEQGGDCVYLINFFPLDDLNALFNYFPKNSKIALLYPENFYGYSINNNIDFFASKSDSMIIARASYKEDLSNAREAIKKLGKYRFRKNELLRQKKILQNKEDEVSKLALRKIQNFETLGNVDFSHIILPDYGIRLLEIAPLLPFYDVDPSQVQFVGTGAWDDKAFFDEPSLQGAIFPGIEEQKRSKFFNDYFYVYKKKPMRTATIPYDLVGILSYLFKQNYNIGEAMNFLDNNKTKFDGIDGKFFFQNNVIFRELKILEINKGGAKKLN